MEQKTYAVLAGDIVKSMNLSLFRWVFISRIS